LKFSLYVIFTFIGIVIVTLIPNVNSHSFYTNKDSTFHTLIKRYQIEDLLASQNQTKSKSIATEHSQNAMDLLKELVYFSNDTKITTNLSNFENAFSNVSLSTKALVAADLADESLKQYGLANGLDERTALDLKTMSVGMIMNMDRMTDHNLTGKSMGQVPQSNMFMSYNNQSNQAFSNLTISNMNEVNYGTSLTIAKSLKNLFTDNLEKSTLENSTGLMQIPLSMKEESVTSLDLGIDNLIQAISSNSSLEHVYSIVHGQIHPNLYLAYNLKLKSD